MSDLLREFHRVYRKVFYLLFERVGLYLNKLLYGGVIQGVKLMRYVLKRVYRVYIKMVFYYSIADWVYWVT